MTSRIMSNQTSHLRALMLNLLADAPDHYPNFLEERFPHVLQRIVALWGKPPMEDYLDSLLAQPKEGTQGFPAQAIGEIGQIRSFYRQHHLLATTEQARAAAIPALPVRETLHSFLRLEEAAYPRTLEEKHPALLQKILPLLGKPELDVFLGELLTFEQQAKHGLCEQPLLEIMTLKALHRAQYPYLSNTQPTSGSDDEHQEAALVFDRIHRR